MSGRGDARKEECALLLALSQTVRALICSGDNPDAALLERLDTATAAAFRPEPQHTISRGGNLSERYHSLGKPSPAADDDGDAAA